MESFETTFLQEVDGRLIAEIDIRVSPSCYAAIPLTIEAACLVPRQGPEQWVAIPLHHPLYAEIERWLWSRDWAHDRLPDLP